MRKLIFVSALMVTGFATAYANGPSPNGTVFADVVRSVPIIEIVRQPVNREICRDTEVYGRQKSATPPILGGIIGGVLGNQFGSGSGRTATTIAGAVLGGSIGADHARRNQSRTERRCEIVKEYTESERVVGYRVTYRYNGQLHSTETLTDPGEFLELKLVVASA